MIRALFRREPERFECGARVYTIRDCMVGFFKKGQRGTVLGNDGQFYLVQFDGESRRWVDPSEIKRIPPRRVPFFQRLSLSWLRLGWFLVLALACWVVPLRVMGIRAGDVPRAPFVVDAPVASAATRN